MALKIKVLSLVQLTSAAAAGTLYSPATSAPAQTAIVKAMRFSNVSASNVTVNIYFVPSGSTYPTNARRIVPKDLALAAGAAFTDDEELTLGSGDVIYGVASNGPASSNWLDC